MTIMMLTTCRLLRNRDASTDRTRNIVVVYDKTRCAELRALVVVHDVLVAVEVAALAAKRGARFVGAPLTMHGGVQGQAPPPLRASGPGGEVCPKAPQERCRAEGVGAGGR